jgi:hypothetical protein
MKFALRPVLVLLIILTVIFLPFFVDELIAVVPSLLSFFDLA